MERPTDRRSSRIAGTLVGAAVGGIVGLLAAINLVITFGPDQGYESSIGDVFDHSTILGLVVVGVAIAGPLVGIAARNRIRR